MMGGLFIISMIYLFWLLFYSFYLGLKALSNGGGNNITFIEFILKSIGWIPESDAIKIHCTHDGRYFIVPCWLNLDEDPIVMVEKHWIFIPFTFFFSGIEYLYNLFLDEDFDNIGFMFKIKRRLGNVPNPRD